MSTSALLSTSISTSPIPILSVFDITHFYFDTTNSIRPISHDQPHTIDTIRTLHTTEFMRPTSRDQPYTTNVNTTKPRYRHPGYDSPHSSRALMAVAARFELFAPALKLRSGSALLPPTRLSALVYSFGLAWIRHPITYTLSIPLVRVCSE